MSWVLEPDVVARSIEPIALELDANPRTSETAIRVALREADHLADDVYDVPAAVLFALGRTPRCFGAFRTMSVLVVEWQAKVLGFRLERTPLELASMLTRVALREEDYEGVRRWMAEGLLPFGG